MGLRTKVTIPKGRNGRAIKNFRKTQKNVTRRIGSTKGLAGGKGLSAGGVGDELARLSGLPSAQRSKRPKDDPFNQIGL